MSNVHSRRRQHAMLVRKVAAGALAGTLVVGLAGPAIAKGRPDAKGPKAKVRGTTSLMFTESVKNKLAKDGIKVEAVAPAQKVNKVKFVFQASQTRPQYIDHTGGLTFTRAAASLTLHRTSM